MNTQADPSRDPISPQDRAARRVSWRRIVSGYLSGRSRDAWLTFIHFMLKEAAARFLPFSLALSVGLLERQDPEWQWKLTLIIGIQILFLAWNIPGHVLYIRHLSRISREHGRQLRTDVCRQLQQLTLLHHGRGSSGKIHSKVIRDIDTIETTPIQLAQPLLAGLAVILVSVTTILIVAPVVAPVFLIMAPMAWGVHAIFKSKMDETARTYRETTERLSSRLEDMLEMIPVTRAHGLEETELASASERIGDVRREAGRFDMVTAAFGAVSWSSITTFNAIFLAIMIVFGFRGLLTIQEVVLFAGLFGHLTFAAMMVLGVVPQIVRLRDSYGSVLEILRAPDLEQNEGRSPAGPVEGRIELERVAYAYPGAPTPAIDGVSLAIQPGETVSIVGPSGGGKSTLLSLVLGFVRPESGRVLLDGQDAADIDMRTWRRQIAVVTQSSVFFSGTLRENIAHGLGHAHDPDMQAGLDRALDLAGARSFIDQLPDGLETRMGEDGRAFSGGQLQRLALARALVRDPRVLILDEPTSSLDAEAELAFREAMERARRGRTVLMVSHSLLNARSADRIVVIQNGRIEATGAHEQLLSGDNFYSRTFKRLAG